MEYFKKHLSAPLWSLMCEIIDFVDHFPKKVNGKTSKVLALASCTSRFCKCQQWMIPSQFKCWGACWEAGNSCYRTISCSQGSEHNCDLSRVLLEKLPPSATCIGENWGWFGLRPFWRAGCQNSVNRYKHLMHQTTSCESTSLNFMVLSIATGRLKWLIPFPGHPNVTSATCLGLQTGQSSEPKTPNCSSERKW